MTDSSTAKQQSYNNSHITKLKENLVYAWRHNSITVDENVLNQRADTVLNQLHELSLNIQERKNTSQMVQYQIGMVGFGSKVLRDSVLSILRYFLRPKLIHASTLTHNRWEGILITKLPSTSTAVENLEGISYNFGSGISLIPLDGLTLGSPMLACLDRIAEGSDRWGNFLTKSNANFRSTLALIRQRQAHERSRETVHHITGLDFTPQNMIHVYQQHSDEARYWRRNYNRNLREQRLFANNLTTRLTTLIQNSIDFRQRLTTDTNRYDSEIVQAFLLGTEINLESVVNSRLQSSVQSSVHIPDVHPSAITSMGPMHNNNNNIHNSYHSVWSYPDHTEPTTAPLYAWHNPLTSYHESDLLDTVNSSNLNTPEARWHITNSIPPTNLFGHNLSGDHGDNLSNDYSHNNPPSHNPPSHNHTELLATWYIDDSGIIRAEGGESVMQIE